jgi:hypothetical protein
VKRRILLLLFPALLFCQAVQPDLSLTFNLASATTGSTLAATTTGPVSQPAVTWRVTWYVDNVSITSATVFLDGAPDNNGVAGTFSHISSTFTIDGTNGGSGATGTFAVRAYFPYVRINITSITGSGGYIRGTLLGYKGTSASASSSSGGGGGAITAPLGLQTVAASVAVVNQGPAADGASTNLENPVRSAGLDAAGKQRTQFTDIAGNQTGYLGCNLTAEVALVSTAYTEIIAGVASKVIYVCKVQVTSASSGTPSVNTFTLAAATVTTCGTPTELFNLAGITGLDSDYGGALRSAAAQSICVKEAVSQSDKVTITYAQYIP